MTVPNSNDLSICWEHDLMANWIDSIFWLQLKIKSNNYRWIWWSGEHVSDLCFHFIFPLFSFIENFGTHIVTSATIGGRDVVYIRQHQSSPLSALDIESYVKDIGNQRFQESTSQLSAGPLKYKDKVSIWLTLKPFFFFFIYS